MFYRKGRTAGYISVIYFRLERFLFDHFVYFLRRNLQSFFGRVMLNKYNMFSNSKNNCFNNLDYNIDQNNRDYDFSHNRAALLYFTILPLLYYTARIYTTSVTFINILQ